MYHENSFFPLGAFCTCLLVTPVKSAYSSAISLYSGLTYWQKVAISTKSSSNNTTPISIISFLHSLLASLNFDWCWIHFKINKYSLHNFNLSFHQSHFLFLDYLNTIVQYLLSYKTDL